MLSTAVKGVEATPVIGPRVLLIEDERALADSIQYSLEAEGLFVVVARDGQEGVTRFREEAPSLVILDLLLPKVPGLEVCRTLRSVSTVPIVIVTAKASEADRVLGLEMGADDYLCKPFSMRELVSRVRANIRRSNMIEPPEIAREQISRGPIRMDLARHEVTVRGERTSLPPKEFMLLQVMLQAQGRLRTRGSLIDEVWGPHYVGDTKTLDVHIKRLRRKIEIDPHRPEHLLTVRGFGYRFVAEAEPESAAVGFE